VYESKQQQRQATFPTNGATATLPNRAVVPPQTTPQSKPAPDEPVDFEIVVHGVGHIRTSVNKGAADAMSTLTLGGLLVMAGVILGLGLRGDSGQV
jgi:hypothetical protein